MLTISELAKRYDLAESTARYYCKRFRQFLPHVGTGKRRRYLESGVPIFEDILAAMQKNKNANAVEVFLQSKYSQAGISGTPVKTGPVAGAPAETAVAAGGVQQDVLEQQTRALVRIADALESLVRQDKVPGVAENASGGVAEQSRELASLREEVKELRTLQLDAERLHQNDLEQLRKWLTRLGRERKEI